MEDIFFYHICSFIEPYTFRKSNFASLCHHPYLKDKHSMLRRDYAAKALNHRFWRHGLKNIMHIFLDDYPYFMKYISGILLNERDVDCFGDILPIQRNKVFVSKHVMSNTIIEFNVNHNISHIDFTSCQHIVEDTYICSIYRLADMKKQILIEHYPYAKALIY